jgi:hypothetical protein
MTSMTLNRWPGSLSQAIPDRETCVDTSGPDLIPALKNESTVGGYRRSRLRNMLVVAQVALSLVLLLCAGLVLRGL